MFLNSEAHLGILSEMKAHALDMYEAIQCGDFVTYGKWVGKTWEQNKHSIPERIRRRWKLLSPRYRLMPWDINFREQAVVVTYIS